MTLANEIENGEGSEYDLLIACGGKPHYEQRGKAQWIIKNTLTYCEIDPRPLTSVDDMIALKKATLPGSDLTVTTDGYAFLSTDWGDFEAQVDVGDETEKMARSGCITILRAKEVG